LPAKATLGLDVGAVFAVKRWQVQRHQLRRFGRDESSLSCVSTLSGAGNNRFCGPRCPGAAQPASTAQHKTRHQGQERWRPMVGRLDTWGRSAGAGAGTVDPFRHIHELAKASERLSALPPWPRALSAGVEPPDCRARSSMRSQAVVFRTRRVAAEGARVLIWPPGWLRPVGESWCLRFRRCVLITLV